MPGFGSAEQFTKQDGGSHGERQNLPEGTYRILHTFEVKDWGDGKGDVLQLKIVKADEDSCCQWLSGGMARGLLPSEDKKRLEGEGQISGATRMAKYFNKIERLAKKAGFSVDFGTLESLDALVIEIDQEPNTHQMAKPGSVVPTPASVSRPKQATDSAAAATGRSNGEAAALTNVQLQAIEALESYLHNKQATPLTRAKANRDAELKILMPFCSGGGEMENMLIASVALTDVVVSDRARG